MKHAKVCYFEAKLREAISDSMNMYLITNTLLNRQDQCDSLPDMDAEQVAHSFSNFFNQKIEKIQESFVDDTLDALEPVSYTHLTLPTRRTV